MSIKLNLMVIAILTTLQASASDTQQSPGASCILLSNVSTAQLEVVGSVSLQPADGGDWLISYSLTALSPGEYQWASESTGDLNSALTQQVAQMPDLASWQRYNINIPQSGGANGSFNIPSLDLSASLGRSLALAHVDSSLPAAACIMGLQPGSGSSQSPEIWWGASPRCGGRFMQGWVVGLLCGTFVGTVMAGCGAVWWYKYLQRSFQRRSPGSPFTDRRRLRDPQMPLSASVS